MDRETFQSIVKTGAIDDPKNPLAKQSFLELLWLTSSHLEPLKPKRVLEIGVANGGTTKLLCHLVGLDGLVVGLDIQKGFGPSLEVEPAFRFILGDSTREEVIEQAEKLAPYDFILFDGNHETVGVEADTRNYLPLLREGGLAVWHDIRMLPPAGIKPYWYGHLLKTLPGAFGYYLNPDNTGYGLWYKK